MFHTVFSSGSPSDVSQAKAWCAAVHGVTVSHDLVTEQQQHGVKTIFVTSLTTKGALLLYILSVHPFQRI